MNTERMEKIANIWNKYQSGSWLERTESESGLLKKIVKVAVPLEKVLEEVACHVSGSVAFPGAGFLYVAWRALSTLNGFKQVEDMPVEFENVEFINDLIVRLVKGVVEPKNLEGTVTFVPSTGAFEILDGEKTLVRGVMRVPEEFAQWGQYESRKLQGTMTYKPSTGSFEVLKGEKTLVQGNMRLPEDFAKRFNKDTPVESRLEEIFEKIQSSKQFAEEENNNGVEWTGKWIPFLETLIQTVSGERGQFVLPKLIRSLVINPRMHLSALPKLVQSELAQSENFGAELPIEFVQRWIERFETQFKTQKSFVERFLTKMQEVGQVPKPVVDEIQKVIFGGEQLFGSFVEKKNMIAQFFRMYQSQFEQHKILSQVYGYFNQREEQSQLVQKIQEIIAENLHFYVEKQLSGFFFAHLLQRVRSLLGKELEIVQTVFGERAQEYKTEILGHFQRFLQETIAYFQQEVAQLAEQTYYTVETLRQTVQQHLATLREYLAQSPSEEFKQFAQRAQEFVQTHLEQYQEQEKSGRLAQLFHEKVLDMLQNHSVLIARIAGGELVNGVFEELKNTVQEKIEILPIFENIKKTSQVQTIKAIYGLHRLQEELETIVRRKIALGMWTKVKPTIVQEFETILTQRLPILAELTSQLEMPFGRYQTEQQQQLTRIPYKLSLLAKHIIAGGIVIKGIETSPAGQYLQKIWNTIELSQHIQPIAAERAINYIGEQCEQQSTRRFAEQTEQSIRRFAATYKTIEKMNEVVHTPFSGQLPLVVVYPLESSVNAIRSWAKQMLYPVYGVQLTHELAAKYETVEKLAEFYQQHIEKEINSRFHVLGFSYGLPIAMEIAARLASKVVSLTVLDSVYPFGETNTLPVNSQTEKVELEALYNFAKQFVPKIAKIELLQQLWGLNTLEQRIQFVLSQIKNKMTKTVEQSELEQSIRTFVTLACAINKYTPIKSIVSRIQTINVIKSGLRNNLPTFAEHFVLGQLFAGKIVNRFIDAEYPEIFEGVNGYLLSNMIGQFLGKYF